MAQHSRAMAPSTARPMRSRSAGLLVAGVGAAMLAVSSWTGPTQTDATFCGGVSPRLRSTLPELSGGVAMEVKSGRWQAGQPNHQEIAARKMSFPSLSNVKDQYFIIYSRSPKIKQWYPINIISGSEAAKAMKSATDNDIAKTLGADKLADYQIVKAIGMQLYKQKDEVKKNAVGMHAPLKYTSELQYGYKEITDNEKFNENPGPFMSLKNINLIPPEEELKNILDSAGEAVGTAGESVSKVSDNIKGFFGQLGSR
eukprot:gb/GFBE01003401.1/.p1 GENE.gb/GFBE01003401.1/~~gb/GFBE01003401.1/.p1  ORF type:complete len:256 (+),score=79.64 gb/GFBE01003401.1/:1-768(+)